MRSKAAKKGSSNDRVDQGVGNYPLVRDEGALHWRMMVSGVGLAASIHHTIVDVARFRTTTRAVIRGLIVIIIRASNTPQHDILQLIETAGRASYSYDFQTSLSLWSLYIHLLLQLLS